MTNIRSNKLDAARRIQHLDFGARIVDIGCGDPPRAWPQATHTIDYKEYMHGYEGKKQIVWDLNTQKKLPIEDNYFDFSICVQVLEHLVDPSFFLHELQRISRRGFIEVPTALLDNLLSIDGDHYGHKWWISIDNKSKLIIKHRLRCAPLISVDTYNYLFHGQLGTRTWFDDSFTLGIFWDTFIDFSIEEHMIYGF